MNNTLRKWLSVLALAFVMTVLSLHFQSARAQYGFEPSPYGGIATSMIERGGFLYIVQGNTVHKIRTKDMAVVGRTQLQPLSPLYAISTPAPTTTPRWGEGTPTPTPTVAGQNGNQ